MLGLPAACRPSAPLVRPEEVPVAVGLALLPPLARPEHVEDGVLEGGAPQDGTTVGRAARGGGGGVPRADQRVVHGSAPGCGSAQRHRFAAAPIPSGCCPAHGGRGRATDMSVLETVRRVRTAGAGQPSTRAGCWSAAGFAAVNVSFGASIIVWFDRAQRGRRSAGWTVSLGAGADLSGRTHRT